MNRMEWWEENHYTSLNVDLTADSSEEEEEEQEEGEEKDIQYVVGDVTHPQFAGTRDALIVHCVGEEPHSYILSPLLTSLSFSDDSGRWGRGGLFSVISARSQMPEQQYRLAGKMRGWCA